MCLVKDSRNIFLLLGAYVISGQPVRPNVCSVASGLSVTSQINKIERFLKGAPSQGGRIALRAALVFGICQSDFWQVPVTA